MPEIPKPNYEDPKEIYAFFGLAYYKTAVLEQGVLNLAVALLATETPGITIGEVDKLYESFNKRTFGQVISTARQRFDFPADLEADLEKALLQRNYLAHRFFVDHDIDLQFPGGRRQMIDDLVKVLRHLQSVDARMDDLWLSAWKSLGITKEWLEEKMRGFSRKRNV